MPDDEKVRAASEIVKSLGGLPAVVLAIVLLFPQVVTGFVLYKLDATMQRLAAAIEKSLERSER